MEPFRMVSFDSNQQWITTFWLSWVSVEFRIIIFKKTWDQSGKDDTLSLGTENRKADHVKKIRIKALYYSGIQKEAYYPN